MTSVNNTTKITYFNEMLAKIVVLKDHCELENKRDIDRKIYSMYSLKEFAELIEFVTFHSEPVKLFKSLWELGDNGKHVTDYHYLIHDWIVEYIETFYKCRYALEVSRKQD